MIILLEACQWAAVITLLLALAGLMTQTFLLFIHGPKEDAKK